MGETGWLALLMEQTTAAQIQKTSEYTEKFGLTLSEKDAELLVQERRKTLIRQKRVEFGGSILPKLIYCFCDSEYVSQGNYVETLVRLQEIFFHYKNEMLDEITDEELLNFMREQFDTVCAGDLDYLEGTCLEIFAEAVRAGYKEQQRTGGRGVYGELDEVPRWDKELYLETLKDLCWR